MPRISPYVIILTVEEVRKLESISKKYTSPYCDVIRAKIVLLAARGMSNDKIADRLDIPRQIASKWRKRFYEERLQGLQDLPRGGRPSPFSPSRGRRRKSLGL